MCSVYGHCRVDNETLVILQSLSHFSDCPDTVDSRGVNQRWHAETRFTCGRNAMLAKTTMAEAETGP